MPELHPLRGRLPASMIRDLKDPDTQPDPAFTAEQQRSLARLGGLMQALRLPRRSMKRRVLMTVGMIWVIGGFLTVGGFLAAFFDLGPLEVFTNGAASCLGMICVIAGAGAIWIGGSLLWDRLVSSQLDTPILDAETHPLKPGQTLKLSYVQRVNNQVQIQGIDFKLIRRETATYTSGTDRHTVTHDTPLAEEQRAGRSASRGHMLDERLEFTIAPDAMHTFASSNNRLQYVLTVTVRLGGWVDFFEEYEVLITA